MSRLQKQSSLFWGIASIVVLLLMAGMLWIKQAPGGTFLSRTPQRVTERPKQHGHANPSQPSSAAQDSPASTTVKWVKQEQPVQFPILMYHAIHDMAPEEAHNANLIVSPALFEEHIKALKEAGYYFLTPEEAYRALTDNALPAEKVIWLTFDDSLWDFHAVAYPILKRYGVTATNNVITGTTANQQQGHLTEAQLMEMKKAGIQFESHTVAHPDLSTSGLDGQREELAESKDYLDKLLNQETSTIVYPTGRYSDLTLELATEAGYKLGLTTNEGLASLDNGLLTLNRVRVLPTMTADNLLNNIEN